MREGLCKSWLTKAEALGEGCWNSSVLFIKETTTGNLWHEWKKKILQYHSPPILWLPEGISHFRNYCCCCSIMQLCLILHDPMDCSMPGFPVPHHLLEFAQVHVHQISDSIQPSHPLLSPSLSVLSLSQHQDLFQWFASLHQVAKLLKLQIQHQSFQRIFRIDVL